MTEPSRIINDGFCTCGGSYDLVHTDQYSHPEQGTTKEDIYRCHKCKTWCIIVWDANGVEVERRYVVDEAAGSYPEQAAGEAGDG